jgi:hypothetical protein
MRSVELKDLLGGLLMLVLGIGMATQASHYEIGSLRRMGPGFFPLALGVILAGTGGLILLSAFRAPLAAARAQFRPEWRGWICILVGLAAFALLGRHAGLLPATFATVFIAALGDRQNSILVASITAAAMTLICLIVFWWQLKVPLPLLPWSEG